MGQTRYPSKSWLFKSCFSFNVRQHGQQQLYFQYKVYWIIGVSSFSQPYLWIQLPLQSPPKTFSSTLVNFHFPIPPLLVHKIILTTPTNTLFLYTSANSHLPIIAYNHPNNLHQKNSLPQPFSQFRLRQGNRVLGSLVRTCTVLVFPYFLKVW